MCTSSQTYDTVLTIQYTTFPSLQNLSGGRRITIVVLVLLLLLVEVLWKDSLMSRSDASLTRYA